MEVVCTPVHSVRDAGHRMKSARVAQSETLANEGRWRDAGGDRDGKDVASDEWRVETDVGWRRIPVTRGLVSAEARNPSMR